MSAPGWPARLAHGDVEVRPFRARDAMAWSEVRIRNKHWLRYWEGRTPTQRYTPWEVRHTPGVFTAMLRMFRQEARAGRMLPFAVFHQGALVGQVTVSSIVRGAFQCGYVGYWIDERVARRGITTTALALVVDHCFGPVGLHRIEANVRPENRPSLRVVEKLGFQQEGRHKRYLFIDEEWRDHLSFALLVEDVRGGVLRGLLDRTP